MIELLVTCTNYIEDTPNLLHSCSYWTSCFSFISASGRCKTGAVDHHEKIFHTPFILRKSWYADITFPSDLIYSFASFISLSLECCRTSWQKRTSHHKKKKEKKKKKKAHHLHVFKENPQNFCFQYLIEILLFSNFRALQDRSFPIVNPLNESFPDHVYRANPDLRTYEVPADLPPGVSVLLTVDNPNPGYWFVVAWLAQDKDDRIKQEVSIALMLRYFY